MIIFLFEPGTWQYQCWNPSECTVVKMHDGKFGILDHSIQTIVATGDNAAECTQWLRKF